MTIFRDTEHARANHVRQHMHVGTVLDCAICTIEYLCNQLDGERGAERNLLWQSRLEHIQFGRDQAEAKLRQIRRLHDDLDASDYDDFAVAVGNILDPPPAPARCSTYDPVTDDCSCVPGIGQPPPAEKCLRCNRPLSAHGPLANCYPLSGPQR